MRNRSTKYHIVHCDRLASCFEVLDPSLKGTEQLMPEHMLDRFKQPCSYAQQINKDWAVIVNRSYLYAGEHVLRYCVRATSVESPFAFSV